MKMEIVFKDGRKGTYDNVVSFNVTEEQTANKPTAKEEGFVSGTAQPYIEGKPYEVNPLLIDRSNFEKNMINNLPEKMKETIQRAFGEIDKHPEKYSSTFYTLIPELKWVGYKTEAELYSYANELGGVMADWVEQALEWVQRISNGESWENVCTANCFRLITNVWGMCVYTGCTRDKFYQNNPRAAYLKGDPMTEDRFCHTVPLVVIKKN